MTRLKILILLLIAVLTVRCVVSDTKTEKEQQLEFAEYVTKKTEPTFYAGCNNYRDSALRQAQVIGDHLSFMDSTYMFNADDYANIYDSNLHNMSKAQVQKIYLMAILGLIFYGITIAGFMYLTKKYVSNPRSIKVKRRRRWINNIILTVIYLSFISIFVYIYKTSPAKNIYTEVQQESLKDYFLRPGIP
jgi:hypothetical protein